MILKVVVNLCLLPFYENLWLWGSLVSTMNIYDNTFLLKCGQGTGKGRLFFQFQRKTHSKMHFTRYHTVVNTHLWIKFFWLLAKKCLYNSYEYKFGRYYRQQRQKRDFKYGFCELFLFCLTMQTIFKLHLMFAFC